MSFIDKVNELKKTITVTKLRKGVYHAQFAGQRDLAGAFRRFQNHHDNPGSKKKLLPLMSDRGSFRVSGDSFRAFIEWQLAAGQLSWKEAALLSAVKKEVAKHQDFANGQSWFLIGTHRKGDGSTLRHEAAHALFFLDRDYRRMTTKMVVPLLGRGGFEAFLKGLGHRKEDFIDEMQAYLSADAEWLSEQLDIRPYLVIALALKLAFEDYWMVGL